MSKQLQITIFIFFLSFFPRLFQLSETFVYPDEITWMVHGKEILYAFVHQNTDFIDSAWWNHPSDAHAIGLPLVMISGISHVLLAGTSKFSLNLFSDILASRLPVVTINSLLPVVFFIFARKHLGDRPALLGSLFLALNPISLGIDRWLLHDSFLAFFSFLSISTYTTCHREGKISILPSLFLALAFLTKPLGILPFISWCFMFVSGIKNKFNTKLFLCNTIGFILFVHILWPQNWFYPLVSVPRYLFNQLNLAQTGDPIPNYYLGMSTNSAGFSYYFFQLATRLPESTIILFVVSLMLGINKRYSHFFYSVLLYSVIFFLILSFSSLKGGARYLLPLFPWIIFSAVYSLQTHLPKIFRNRILFISLTLSFVYPFILHPNYYLYYNHIIGGTKNAIKYDLVGLCFGTKEALSYLDQNFPVGSVAVLGCADSASYHTHRPLTKNSDIADFVILESSFRQQFPQRDSILNLKSRTLIREIIQNDVVTARVFF